MVFKITCYVKSRQNVVVEINEAKMWRLDF
jgi:hypothetical protein